MPLLLVMVFPSMRIDWFALDVPQLPKKRSAPFPAEPVIWLPVIERLELPVALLESSSATNSRPIPRAPLIVLFAMLRL